MTRTNGVMASSAISSGSVSIVGLSYGYYSLAIAGALIGIISWFYGYTHSEPRWEKSESASEFSKYVLFGTLVMPAVVEGSSAMLEDYGLNVPSVRLLIGGLAAFLISDIIGLAVPAMTGFIKNYLYKILGIEKDEK